MARIVYAWELGAGYGHLAAFAPLGKALQDAGHQVTFVIRDLTHAEALLAAHGISYLQAPLWQGRSPQLPFPINYAEMLLSAGYASASELLGLLHAWRGLFKLLQADLLLFDHAPTALLAARGLPGKRMILGQGFFPPPQLTPLPSIRPENPITQEQLQAAEARVLAAINQVVASPLPSLAEMFQVDANLLCTYPELDLYAPRQHAEYIGAALQLDGGSSFHWPSGDGAKIFVYLQAHATLCEQLISALTRLPVRAVIHAPALSAASLQKLQQPNLSFSAHPLHMRQACAEADLAIGNAGLGTLSAMLLAGKPQLLLPFHQEQFLLAQAAVRLGAAIMLPAPLANPDYAQAIRELLEHPRYRAAAVTFQKKYRAFSPAQQSADLLARCEQLLR